MRTDLDTIRDGLAAVWPTQGRKFVTFELDRPGEPSGPLWVQYLDGELNVAWPLPDEPAVYLPSHGVKLPAGAFPSWHVPGSNAVLCVGDAKLDDLAELIDALFAALAPSADRRRVVARIDAHG